MKQNGFSKIADQVIAGMEERNAQKISVIDLTNIENSVSSYFVVCEGNSNTQVKAIAQSIEKKVNEELEEKPWHVEGTNNAEWVLLDYVNTVAHVFLPQTREFYQLEELWGDAEITCINA